MDSDCSDPICLEGNREWCMEKRQGRDLFNRHLTKVTFARYRGKVILLCQTLHVARSTNASASRREMVRLRSVTRLLGVGKFHTFTFARSYWVWENSIPLLLQEVK